MIRTGFLVAAIAVSWLVSPAWEARIAFHRSCSILAMVQNERSGGEENSDVCPACNGAGEVGDGRIMVKCEECDGTGKRK